MISRAPKGSCFSNSEPVSIQLTVFALLRVIRNPCQQLLGRSVIDSCLFDSSKPKLPQK